MKIAIVSDYYYPQLGGITEHVHGQATELTRRGHDVTVVTPRLVHAPPIVDGDDPPERDFELVRIGRAWPFYVNGGETLISLGPRIPRALDRLFAAEAFDVVHVHNPFGLTLPFIATLRSPTSTVGTLHSVVPDRYRPLRILSREARRALRKLDARVAVSRAVVGSIGQFFPDLDFQTIPNGIDTNFFSPAATPVAHVQGRRTIVFVGRFDPRNGVKTMIHAFTRLRGARDDVRLVIVGDGPLRPMVERLVPDGLRGDVHFAGRVNRMRPRYLTGADILCTPCRLASFGMVLLEGMSCGRPVVASRLPGFELVMRDGIDGVMVDPAEGEAGFADALQHLLEDRGAARDMGAAGRERALATFSWKVVGDQLEALYEGVQGRSSSPVAVGTSA
jgi:phosphatidyl-myo-inositol alpha-mannosyltransferase